MSRKMQSTDQIVVSHHIKESEKIQQKFTEFQRRIDDTVVEHYPQMIQTMITEHNYSELARFGDAFKYRTEFSNTYSNTTGTDIIVRDSNDLYAYMYLNSDLGQQETISFKYAVEYILGQSSDMTLGEQRELFLQICIDEKEELFEQYSGYMNVIVQDLNEELVLMKNFLMNPVIHQYSIFCNKQHEVKVTTPYNIFTTLSPEERMEIVRGTYKEANLYNRSPLYPAFLLMMYPKDTSISHDVCIRHPFLMVCQLYIDDLSLSIVALTKSEPVIRRIVKSYADNFNIDEADLLLKCLNKIHR